MNKLKIDKRVIDKNNNPFVIAEIGINHNGNFKKAKKMIEDAHKSGAECVKFQRHVIEDEMTPDAKKIIPGNAKKSIWEIMKKCSLSLDEHKKLKNYTEKLGMIYLCTPFSKAAADDLESIDVKGYKIGSGECNNYPLIEHIASFGKPIILSTGMNNIKSIKQSVNILKRNDVEHAILHCTSLYPTPYEKVRLGAIEDLRNEFPNTILGLSDHSIGNYTCFAALALGALILEKHFTSNKNWPGPDIPISIEPKELKDLIIGSRAVHKALGGEKKILKDEKITSDFAYASVVTIKNIKKGERFTKENIWVKRPGTGEIKAKNYKKILGKKASRNIKKNNQLKFSDIKSNQTKF